MRQYDGPVVHSGFVLCMPLSCPDMVWPLLTLAEVGGQVLSMALHLMPVGPLHGHPQGPRGVRFSEVVFI